MPNTLPPTNTPPAFREKLKIGQKKSLVDFGIHAGVSDLSHIKELAELKPASFKIFMDLVDGDFLLKAFDKIKGLLLITLYPCMLKIVNSFNSALEL
jgi:dihydroorotase